MRDTIIYFVQGCDYVLHYRFVLRKLYVTALFYMFYLLYQGYCAFYKVFNGRNNRVAFSAGYLVTNVIAFLLVSIRVVLQFLFKQHNKQM